MVHKFVDDTFPQNCGLEDVEKPLLNKNRIFIDRTKGVGVMSTEDAIAWSMTSAPWPGPAVVKRDIRKDEPYLCFADNWDGPRLMPAVDLQSPRS